MWPDNPITGLINRATSAVKNYVANKISTVVSNARNIVSQKSSSLLGALTPSNPFRIGKSEKAEKASGFGVSLATEGGKKGRMVSPEGERDTPQVNLSIVVGLTDVWGSENNIPNIASVLDTSNPDIKGGEEGSSSTMSNSNDGDNVTIETENSRAVPKIGINLSQVQTFKKDTVVKKSDVNKVRSNDEKQKNKAYEDAKRNNSNR
ncbi:hypothetical protein BC749_101312 [Flavobacterium araucananum]|nr:hypothetical protein [Flavobacterium araucananum]PWK02249.1 hypothetical protein BC749_101312 [Flavobacterium araucananum]